MKQGRFFQEIFVLRIFHSRIRPGNFSFQIRFVFSEMRLGFVFGSMKRCGSFRKPFPESIPESEKLKKEWKPQDEDKRNQASQVLHESANHRSPTGVTGVVQKRPEKTAHGEAQEKYNRKKPAIPHLRRLIFPEKSHDKEEGSAPESHDTEYKLQQSGTLKVFSVLKIVCVLQSSHDGKFVKTVLGIQLVAGAAAEVASCKAFR